MIILSIVILQEEDKDSNVIGFKAKDIGGCTELEQDIADDFREVLIEAREAIIKKHGWKAEDIMPPIYRRETRTQEGGENVN